MDVQLTDFVTIGVLVVLEGLLSADNALVVAVMILGLPRVEQKKALRYGLVGAFAFRIARDAARDVYLIRLGMGEAARRRYISSTSRTSTSCRAALRKQRSRPKPAQPWLGLSALWGDGRQSRAGQRRVLGRLDPGRRRDVVEDLGGADGRAARHRRDARRHRATAGDRPPLSDDRRRRLHDHRDGSASSC